MTRKEWREEAIKLAYQSQISNDSIDDQLKIHLEENELENEDYSYLKDVLYGISEHSEEIDGLISKYAKNWTIDRIAKVDLGVLRVAIYEILYKKDIPFKVSINEAVEMCKKYGGENSKGFVNGILASVVTDTK